MKGITKRDIVLEFENRLFEESYVRIYKCLSLLEENQLWLSPNGNIPSIGCLLLHLCGNARQWILSGLGGEEDNRVRDDEFVIQRDIKKVDFYLLMENLKSQLKICLMDLDESELTRPRRIQGFNVTGFSALVHVIEHFSYHTGQITTLTKIYVNKDTGYYSGLDLDAHNRLN